MPLQCILKDDINFVYNYMLLDCAVSVDVEYRLEYILKNTNVIQDDI